MSWRVNTWQPPVRRDGPLVVGAAFFLLPCLFFLVTWYADYFAASSSTVVMVMVAIGAVLGPALLCFRYASRAGRRRILWSALVLGGSVMSMWLPVQYLFQGGPLPISAHIPLPQVLRQVSATTTVALLPLLMGTIPVVLYGLVPGQDRPTEGTPPRGAVLLTAGAGIVLWAAALYLTLLNPAPPPLVPPGERVVTDVEVIRPPALPGELLPQTWTALLWRLHDGVAPGATDLSRESSERLIMQLPESVERENLAILLMGKGIIEFVDVGNDPPPVGSTISTSGRALSDVDEVFDTIVTPEQFTHTFHWSGQRISRVTVQEDGEMAVLIITLTEEGQNDLQGFARGRRGSFLTLTLDNQVIISFPVSEAIADNTLVVRRLDVDVAHALAAIMRYGPLQLVPTFSFTD